MKNLCGRRSARLAVQGTFIVAIACLTSTHAEAQGVDKSSATTEVSTPRTADGHPDLNGVWYNGNGHLLVKTGNKTLAARPTATVPDDPNLEKAYAFHHFDGLESKAADPNKPPYKPELLDKVHDLDLHENQVDPSFFCHPPGIPRMGAPRQIVETPGQVVLLYQNESGNFFRVVPTDGRPHRTYLDASYMGDSVGHWEGDTLVVDVNNFNDDTWLNTNGAFHSTALHVMERFTREGNVLHYQATVEDPNVFTRPWVLRPQTIKLNADPMNVTYEEPPCVEEDESHIVNHEHL